MTSQICNEFKQKELIKGITPAKGLRINYNQLSELLSIVDKNDSEKAATVRALEMFKKTCLTRL